MPPIDPDIITQSERSPQVPYAAPSIELGLRSRDAHPFQAALHRWIIASPGKPGDRFRLIEPSVAFAGSMQWHRDPNVRPGTSQALVAKCNPQPNRQLTNELDLAAVLYLMNEVPHRTLETERGHGGIETKLAFPARTAFHADQAARK